MGEGNVYTDMCHSVHSGVGISGPMTLLGVWVCPGGGLLGGMSRGVGIYGVCSGRGHLGEGGMSWGGLLGGGMS